MDAVIPLPARTDVGGLAARAVRAASVAAMRLAGVDGEPQLDPDRIAVAYTSDRWMRIDGVAPTAFAPLSGFFRTADGWVRTHANYPHHRTALLRGLGLGPDAKRPAVATAFAGRPTGAAVDAVAQAGGLCVAVCAEEPAADASLRHTPPVELRRLSGAPALTTPEPSPESSPEAPLRGIRVLDLTRVIAGPVATRTLALLGAEVLRIDPPQLVEPAHQHLDTGHGKRSALLDLRSPTHAARFEELLATADVVALGYRGTGLASLGVTPATLAARHPGVVVLSLSAWGTPDRRGFDSLVQAESGIAFVEGATEAPGVLPAQALDHSAGYLLAAAAMELLDRRAREGGSWLARTSLRRLAAELLGMPRTARAEPASGLEGAAGHTQDFTVDGVRVTTAAPAVGYPGGPVAFAAPRPWGADEPAWI